MSMCYPHDEVDDPRHSPFWVFLIFLAMIAMTLMGACAGKSSLPPPAPPAIPVYIPVTQPCEVAQVESSTLNTDDGAPADIYGAVQQLLADLQLLKADREELQAATDNPCPEVTP